MRIEVINKRIGSVYTFSYRDVDTAKFIEDSDPDLAALEILMVELERGADDASGKTTQD